MEQRCDVLRVSYEEAHRVVSFVALRPGGVQGAEIRVAAGKVSRVPGRR